MEFTPRRFLAALALAALLVVGLNGVVARLSANSVTRQALRRVTQGPPIDVVTLGNSVVAAGFDEAAFDRGRGTHPPTHTTRSRNGGLGATGPVQHLLLGRATFAAHPELQVLIYGIVGTLLTDPQGTDWWRLFGNNALVFQAEPEVAARHLAPGAVNRLAFLLASRVPWFVERGTLWAKVERTRRWLGQIGLPPVESNRFGRLEDFAQNGAGNEAPGATGAPSPSPRSVNLKSQISDLRFSPVPAPITPAARELLRSARERGLRVWVVMMPLPQGPLNPARPEWTPYVAHLRGQIEDLGGGFWNAADWVPDRGRYMDDLHLGPEAAAEFSERLGRELARHP